jgi:hypothetical protein
VEDIPLAVMADVKTHFTKNSIPSYFFSHQDRGFAIMTVEDGEFTGFYGFLVGDTPREAVDYIRLYLTHKSYRGKYELLADWFVRPETYKFYEKLKKEHTRRLKKSLKIKKKKG